MLASQKMIDTLNAQIGNELAAHNQYVACAAYYEGLTMREMHVQVAAAAVVANRTADFVEVVRIFFDARHNRRMGGQRRIETGRIGIGGPDVT